MDILHFLLQLPSPPMISPLISGIHSSHHTSLLQYIFIQMYVILCLSSLHILIVQIEISNKFWWIKSRKQMLLHSDGSNQNQTKHMVRYFDGSNPKSKCCCILMVQIRTKQNKWWGLIIQSKQVLPMMDHLPSISLIWMIQIKTSDILEFQLETRMEFWRYESKEVMHPFWWLSLKLENHLDGWFKKTEQIVQDYGNLYLWQKWLGFEGVTLCGSHN